MLSSRQIVIFLLVFGLLPVLAWGAPQAPKGRHTAKVRAASRRQAEPVSQPAAPPPPLTPEQSPAQPPQVSYLNGQLTIISRNSTLGDILRAVSRQTGAVIELPPGAGFERVAGRMGPGPARDVLAELLNGSRYDYVMIASAANPGGLQHVILTTKSAGGEGPSSSPPAAAYQAQPQPDEQVMPNDDEMPPDTSADDQQNPPAEEAPAEQPSEQPPSYPQPGTAANPPSNGQPASGVKTPEQLLQELQRMQQLQKQQQQQQQSRPQ